MSFPLFENDRSATETPVDAASMMMAPAMLYWNGWGMAAQFWLESMRRFANDAGEQRPGVVTLHSLPVARRPEGLEEARSGTPDDLKMISGIGPKIETVLHGLGIFHFDQIAQWAAEELLWVDNHLNFKGRAVREDWVAQADALAMGGRDEYVKRFGKEPR
jgi:NADH-quinone oxidoreductase subunit E